MPAKVGLAEQELALLCVQALNDLGFGSVEFSRGEITGPHDGLLHLNCAGLEVDYLVWIKSGLSKRSLPLLKAMGARSEVGRLITFTDHVDQAVAESFRKNGVEFIDSAGNIFLNQPPLFIYVSGQKRKQPMVRIAKAFRSSGLKLIFLLIKKPEAINWTYRRIAETSGNALGSVGQLIEDLRTMGFIRMAGNRLKYLEDYDELISRWEMHYAEDLRPKLVKARCRMAGGKPIETLLEGIGTMGSEGKILVGGELGASLLLKMLRPEKATLHIAEELSKVSTRLRLIPDENGPVTILNAFGRANQYEELQSGMCGLADPLLIHAEILLENSDRLRSIANYIYQTHILSRFVAK